MNRHWAQVAAAMVLLSFGVGCGPVGPIAGGHLRGVEAAWPPDWSSVADLPEAQLETRLDDPYSINIWFVVLDGQAFLASSLLHGPELPEEREWVRNVDHDPRVRIRIGGVVYSARLVNVDDPDLATRALGAFRTKYPHLDTELAKGARFYRVVGPGSAAAS